jgi:hypothetical protein
MEPVKIEKVEGEKVEGERWESEMLESGKVKGGKVESGKVGRWESESKLTREEIVVHIAALNARIAELEGHLAGRTGNSILSEAEHLTTHDRNQSYGHPSDDYGRVTGAFNALTGHKLTTQQGILFMVCVKLAREAYKPKRDNRVDAAGYLNCLDMTEQARDLGSEFTTGSQPSRPVAAGLQGAETTEKARPAVPVANQNVEAGTGNTPQRYCWRPLCA